MALQNQNKLQTPLILALLATGLVILIATSFGKEIVKIVTDLMYVAITGIFVMVSSLMASRFRKVGSHAKAWLFFLATSIAWCIAETLWAVYELVYKQNPFPSMADVFYLIGYPLFFGFLVYYLKPIRRAITKKMVTAAIIISSCIAMPSIYMAYSFDPNVSVLENLLATAYPIWDAIIFTPAIIGLVLFFRGEVNFTWSLVCTGIFCFTMGDIGFQYAQFNNTYYTGHPSDIVLMWAYILFTFGAWDHLRLFKKEKTIRYPPKIA